MVEPPRWERRADVLVLAGDLTANGRIAEARELLSELRWISVPVVAVLGSHDFEQNHSEVVFHGHGHYGTVCSHTRGGIPVFNVAKSLVVTYHLLELSGVEGASAHDGEFSAADFEPLVFLLREVGDGRGKRGWPLCHAGEHHG